MSRNLGEVTAHYLMALVWADALEGEPYLGIADSVRKTAQEDCAAFLKMVEEAEIDDSKWTDEQFGHDFWLTRQHHGAGFWDRGLGRPGEQLTALAQTFASQHVSVGDDGLLYAD